MELLDLLYVNEGKKISFSVNIIKKEKKSVSPDIFFVCRLPSHSKFEAGLQLSDI